jgi:hypothetical protein
VEQNCPVKEVTEAISLLPYNNYSDENPEINWDQIVSSIYSGNLPSTYYSNEVQADASIVDGNPLTNPDGSGWAKMAYLGWKTLGMNYLRSLNLYANKDLEGMTVGTLLSTMSKQWPDYGEMFNSFHSFTSKSTVTQEQRVELLNKQLWFYKKYVNGIPLDYTKTGKEATGWFLTQKMYLMKYSMHYVIKKHLIAIPLVSMLLKHHTIQGTTANLVMMPFTIRVVIKLTWQN